MSKLVTLCLAISCNNIVDVILTEDGENKTIEAVSGTLCKSCQAKEEAEKHTKKTFDTPRIREKKVEDSSDFNEMMKKRKLEARKKSGKGAPRGNR